MLATPVIRTINDAVLAEIRRMPSGGGYATTSSAMDKLQEATLAEPGMLEIHTAAATPSFCSGATYLVFLKVVEKLVDEQRVPLSTEAIAALPIRRQADGVGVWGRWNANGPGTARLFHELGLGRNFTSIDDALPGDFLKIFWNDQIGSREFGHSVIFLGRAATPAGAPAIRFWSSNKPGGYGERVVELTKVKRTLFSRFEHPERLSAAPGLGKDAYLAAMLKRASTADEMGKMVGLR